MSKQQGAVKTLDTQVQQFKVSHTGDRIIEGYFTTTEIDRGGDISLPSAFEKTLVSYMKNPIVTYMHSIKDVIGKVLEYKVDDMGIWVKAQIAKGVKLADEVWALIEQGIIKGFSYGYKTLQAEPGNIDGRKVNYLKEVELYEIAVVTLPMNGSALFAMGSDGLLKSITLKLENIATSLPDIETPEQTDVEEVEVGGSAKSHRQIVEEKEAELIEEGDNMTIEEIKQAMQDSIKEAVPQIADAVITAIKAKEDAESEAIIQQIEEKQRQEDEQAEKAKQAMISEITAQMQELMQAMKKEEK